MFSSKVLKFPRIPNRYVLDFKSKPPTHQSLQIPINNPPKPQYTPPTHHNTPKLAEQRHLTDVKTAIPFGNPTNSNSGVHKYYQVTLMRSWIGLPSQTRKIIHVLGLKKRHQVVWHPINSSIAGMLLKLKEIITVELVSDVPQKVTRDPGFSVIGNSIGKWMN